MTHYIINFSCPFRTASNFFDFWLATPYSFYNRMLFINIRNASAHSIFSA